MARLRALIQRFQASFPGRVIAKFGEDQGQKQAVLIAWNGIFAMFPILLVMAAILGLVLSHAGFSTQSIYQQVLAAIPDGNSREQVLQGVEGVKTKTGIFFVIGFAGLLWSGSALFGTMEESFDVIFHARKRGFVAQKLMSFLMIVLFTVLAGLTLATSSLLPALQHLSFVPGALTSEPLAALLQVTIGVLSGLILFSTIYFVVPNRKQSFRTVWPGALVAGVLFEALTLAFPLYIHFTGSASTYGKSFGLLFVLLTFFYFLGLITMLGVEFNSVLFPIPVEQPDRAAALAPPEDAAATAAADGDKRPHAEPEAPARRPRVRPRTAVVVALLASVAGLLLGRRSGKRSGG
jgi:membrane protein